MRDHLPNLLAVVPLLLFWAWAWRDAKRDGPVREHGAAESNPYAKDRP